MVWNWRFYREPETDAKTGCGGEWETLQPYTILLLSGSEIVSFCKPGGKERIIPK